MQSREAGTAMDRQDAKPDLARDQHRFGRRSLLAAAATGAAAVGIGWPSAARAAARCEPRYFGYRAADLAKPYAKYMKPAVDPLPSAVADAIAAGPVPSSQVPPRRTLAAQIEREDHGPREIGYGRTSAGEIWVACLTDMPRVSPEMWDWWFAWHSRESARYKLWHPEAHAFAALRDDRAGRGDDRSQYRGNVSYVDEVIGGRLDQLAIGFRHPGAFGIDAGRIDGTVIAGTVGTSLAPVNIGQVVHALRRTERGAEMRSRFYLNVAGVRSFDLDAFSCAVARGVALPRSATFDVAFGAALLRHCGEEMNHLAQFLPELYDEFSGTP